MLATPNLPVGIGRAARADDQIHLRQRHFVLLDDPHHEPVGELVFLNRRQLQRRRRARLLAASTIGLAVLPPTERHARHAQGRHTPSLPTVSACRVRAPHCLLSGTTDSSTRRSFGR